MASLGTRARVAGLLYLAFIVVGLVRLIYIPSALFVSGNSAATAHNIASHETLFRVGIFTDLWAATLEIFVVLALYRLLNAVDREIAVIMLFLGVMDVPVFFANSLNDFGALLLSRGGDFLAAFGEPQRQAMVMLFVNLHHYGEVANEIFWGLWLLPFGILVYKSGFLPRLLGGWLILNGLAYLAQNFAGILFPQYGTIVDDVAFPLEFGEVAIMTWLLVMGASARPVRPGVI